MYIEEIKCTSSHTEVFCKKGLLRNFAKFTKKYFCESLCFSKVAGLKPEKGSGFLLEKSSWWMQLRYWDREGCCHGPQYEEFLTYLIPLVILYPMKTSENLWFSDTFREHRKKLVIRNWSKTLFFQHDSEKKKTFKRVITFSKLTIKLT